VEGIEVIGEGNGVGCNLDGGGHVCERNRSVFLASMRWVE
jgi:hypothetical protein